MHSTIGAISQLEVGIIHLSHENEYKSLPFRDLSLWEQTTTLRCFVTSGEDSQGGGTSAGSKAVLYLVI